jgi:hypothetical protein
MNCRLASGLIGIATGAAYTLAACSVVPSRDDALRDRLVGKWAEARHFDNAHEQQSIELSPDGRLHIEQAFHYSNGTENTVRDGKWRVQGGDFVYETSGSCSRTLGNKPAECRHRIIAVTDWEWVMEESAGVPGFRAWRYPK